MAKVDQADADREVEAVIRLEMLRFVPTEIKDEETRTTLYDALSVIENELWGIRLQFESDEAQAAFERLTRLHTAIGALTEDDVTEGASNLGALREVARLASGVERDAVPPIASA